MGETFSTLFHSKNPPNKLKSSRQPPATPADNRLDDSTTRLRPTETIEKREPVIGSKASACEANSHPVVIEEVSPAHQPTPQSLRDVEMSSKTPKRKPVAQARDLQQDHRLTAASPNFDAQQARKGPYHHALQNSNASGETSQPPVSLWSWIPHISQSADDSTVIVRVKEVLVHAEQFVSNFYHDRARSDMRPNQHLGDINHSPILSVDALATELARADHQLPLIKHSLITWLLSLISFETDAPEKSLLPKEFRNFTVLAEARGNSTETDNEILHLQPALSAYRVLSAYIRSDVQKDRNYRLAQKELVEDVATSFGAAFEYWAKPGRSSDQRFTWLVELLEKAASLGIFLFSQPSVFLFNWQVSAKELQTHGIPVWPRMLRIFDNNAQFRDPADLMIAMKFGIIVAESSHEPKRPMSISRTNSLLARSAQMPPRASMKEMQDAAPDRQQFNQDSRPGTGVQHLAGPHGDMEAYPRNRRMSGGGQFVRPLELEGSAPPIIHGQETPVKEMDASENMPRHELAAFDNRVRDQNSGNTQRPDIARVPSLSRKNQNPQLQGTLHPRASSSSPPKHLGQRNAPPTSFPASFESVSNYREQNQGSDASRAIISPGSVSQSQPKRSLSKSSSRNEGRPEWRVRLQRFADRVDGKVVS